MNLSSFLYRKYKLMDNEIKLSDKCISTNLSEKTSFKKNICIVENKFCTKYQFKKVRVVAIEK